MTIVNVNGIPAETGCYIDGHWGQYGPDRLAEIAEGFDWVPDDPLDDPRELRNIADNLADDADDGVVNVHAPQGWTEADAWERHHEAAERILDWLNDHTHGTRKSDGADVTWGEVDGAWFLNDGTVVPDDQEVRKFVWHWHDGEVFLSTICDDPDTCTDDTCAHWD